MYDSAQSPLRRCAVRYTLRHRAIPIFMAMLPETGRAFSVATPGLPPGKVLVVDDERANVEVLTRMMRREGYEVISASNGELALEAVARYRPDLVLMDVNMPVVNGFEACRQLKRETATRLLPVI